MNWVFWALILIIILIIWLLFMCIFKSLGRALFHTYDKAKDIMTEEETIKKEEKEEEK